MSINQVIPEVSHVYTKEQYIQLQRDIDQLILSKNTESDGSRFLKITPSSLKRELLENSESKKLSRKIIGSMLNNLKDKHPCIKKPVGDHKLWVMLSSIKPPAAILPDGTEISADTFEKFVNIIHDGFGRNFTDHKCMNVLLQLKQFFTQEATQ